MKVERKKRTSNREELEMGKYKFEKICNYKYTGTIVNDKNEKRVEINNRIQAGYRKCFRSKLYMNNKGISKDTKIKLSKAAISDLCDGNDVFDKGR